MPQWIVRCDRRQNRWCPTRSFVRFLMPLAASFSHSSSVSLSTSPALNHHCARLSGAICSISTQTRWLAAKDSTTSAASPMNIFAYATSGRYHSLLYIVWATSSYSSVRLGFLQVRQNWKSHGFWLIKESRGKFGKKSQKSRGKWECVMRLLYRITVLTVVLYMLKISWCTSGCVVECQICNREVAGLNLGLGYFAPRYTQPSISLGSVNEYQLWLGRQRQV